jgi:hypothetical protein
MELSFQLNERCKMKTWIIRAKNKKSTIERESYVKDDQTIWVETGWRSGSFFIVTNDGNPPAIDLSNPDNDFEVYSFSDTNVHEVGLCDTFDGCWTDVEFPEDMSDEEQERLQDLIDDDGAYETLTSEGWEPDDGEVWLHGPLILEDEDENVIADGESA